MTAASAVGIDDDLAACQSRIAVWSTKLETPGRIHMDRDPRIPPLAEDWFDDLINHLVAEFILTIVPSLVVLGRDNDSIDADWFAIVVLDRDLALCIRTQSRDDVPLAHLRLTSNQLVAQHDRERHQLLSLLTRESEHHPLIARTLFIHTHRNVRRLLVD